MYTRNEQRGSFNWEQNHLKTLHLTRNKIIFKIRYIYDVQIIQYYAE